MATRERPGDRGRRRAADDVRRLGADHRVARTGVGLSVRDVARATRTSHQQVLRFENGRLPTASIEDVGAWCAVVGLDLVVRAYPGGDPIRDVGQQRVLDRLKARLHADLTWRTEVPLPLISDRRAWDAVITGRGWAVHVEAETVLADLQALQRRMELKRRDGGATHVILLVSDTTRNRRALAAAPAALVGFDRDSRSILRALGNGEAIERDGLVLL
jgi:transcriptional regulator with XRE-family HTH domain